MTTPDDRDPRLEDLLRDALQSDAETVMPTGDGLARIQQRIETRRTRRLWLRPLAVAAGIAVVAGAGVAAYSLSRPKPTNTELLTNPTPPVQPLPASPSPSPSPQRTAAALAFPSNGIFPYTDTADEQADTVSWSGDPAAVAQHFVTDFAGVTGASDIISADVGKSAAVIILGRAVNGAAVPVTSVHLVHFDKSWIVTGANDGRGLLAIASPAAGADVTSPLTVTGPDFGVDESVQLTVRSLRAAAPLGTGNVSFGNDGAKWSAALTFASAPDAVGAVVAYETSAADGGPARLTAVPVHFGNATLVAYPRYFYGVKNGRVTKMSSRDGAAISYLTPTATPSAAADPQLVGDRIYYLLQPPGCGTTLMSVSTSGGTASNVSTPRPGYSISSFAVSNDNNRVAVFEAACNGSGAQPQGLLVSREVNGHGQPHTIAFPSFPPIVESDPSWEPDGIHLDAIVRTGTVASIVRYDAFGATGWSDSSDPCPSFTSKAQAGLPTALQVDGSGALWFAVQNGATMSAYRCAAGAATEIFSIGATDTPSDLAVTTNGDAALLSDGAGTLWRWTGGSSVASRLAPSTPQPHVTW